MLVVQMYKHLPIMFENPWGEEAWAPSCPLRRCLSPVQFVWQGKGLVTTANQSLKKL